MHSPNKAPIATFDAPYARLGKVHIDLVGPFFPLQGQRLPLTRVDQFNPWCQAIPLANSHTKTVTLPSGKTGLLDLANDCGPQFESMHFVIRIQTTTYQQCSKW